MPETLRVAPSHSLFSPGGESLCTSTESLNAAFFFVFFPLRFELPFFESLSERIYGNLSVCPAEPKSVNLIISGAKTTFLNFILSLLMLL